MAKLNHQIIVGIDVSKATLEVYRDDLDSSIQLDNSVEAIEAFLAQLPAGTLIAAEPTGTYHEKLVAVAAAHEVTLYLIDGRRLSRYREAVGIRAKTDLRDAALLARYLTHEQAHLRPLAPRKAEEIAIWRLLHRRASLVAARSQIKQILSDVDNADQEQVAVFESLGSLIKRIEVDLVKLARTVGWGEDLRRVQALPGVALVTGLALVAAYRRHPFRNADAFIAYMGLDVRVQESGAFRGKGRLTKKGSPELRRLLFIAGRVARRHAQPFTDYFERMTGRGKSNIAADMAVGRKIARIAFALLRNQTQFSPRTSQEPCMAT